jgi:hypothetical protein
MARFIFKTPGTYLGFITQDNHLFSRDGDYLAWLEGNHVWDKSGRFRGQIWKEKYIISNRFAVAPVPRPPKNPPPRPALPDPPANLDPVVLPTGWIDAF